MGNLNALYNAKFYKNQADKSYKSAKMVLPVVLAIVPPPIKTAVDFGCGMGTWLAALKELGVDEIKGYDGEWVDKGSLFIPPESFSEVRLDKKISLEKRYDMAISLEVAEHLPETSAKTFVQTLTSASDIVLFSAAVPHQGGTNHINEQWPEYWFTLFKEFDYMGIDCLRNLIWNNPEIGIQYRQNIFLYVKKDIINKIKIQNNLDCRINIIHPELYILKLKAWTPLTAISLKILYKTVIARTIKKIIGKKLTKIIRTFLSRKNNT
jgi:hypothetical protein